MKLKDQVVFDIGADKFKYLQRVNKNKNNRVDIIDLNKRLNITKKNNVYTNLKIIFSAFLFLGVITLISLKV